MHYLDNRATLTGFLEALKRAAPRADVVLLHAGALDLRRMFVGRAPSPVLLAGNRPDSLTHAYTSMKLLSQRLGALAYDLVVVGDVAPRRARRMADRLTECADHFLGAALRHLAVLDPLASPQALLASDLIRLTAAQAAGPGLAPEAAVPAGLLSTQALSGPRRQGAAAGRMN
jgi:flagellar biosynthesis protein FlhG